MALPDALPVPAVTPSIPAGRVDVADSAIAAIVHSAVMSCYGIVDMAPRTVRSAIGKRLGITSRRRGIAVHVEDGRVLVELSVVVEYGTPIFTVARNVMKTVQFQVERTLGMPVERVDVSVEGLRVSAVAPARGRP
ncbi:MAG: Asp23/Gls24 family envelope stress response protein [Chloroflexia bacterium]|nr:Asp23/Gls24 family envelope stress response protein [Chloroflexia bacterium]MDQ3512101.1 Asp23/Gls24 family envelope stress response protein [Chloroflexota bacterium]